MTSRSDERRSRRSSSRRRWRISTAGSPKGIGQALAETAAYRDGQLLCGSFMDYALPRASDLPFFAAETDESQPCTHNPLGAKGCGESRAIGASRRS